MSGSLGRLVAAFCCALALPVGAQAQGLKFFKNYFHTGGHYAQGVSLRGTGTGGFAEATITIAEDASGAAGLPENADVLVALLYWETVTSTSGNGTAGAIQRPQHQRRGEVLEPIWHATMLEQWWCDGGRLERAPDESLPRRRCTIHPA